MTVAKFPPRPAREKMERRIEALREAVADWPDDAEYGRNLRRPSKHDAKAIAYQARLVARDLEKLLGQLDGWMQRDRDMRERLREAEGDGVRIEQ